jgi:hypothetical protein
MFGRKRTATSQPEVTVEGIAFRKGAVLSWEFRNQVTSWTIREVSETGRVTLHDSCLGRCCLGPAGLARLIRYQRSLGRTPRYEA